MNKPTNEFLTHLKNERNYSDATIKNYGEDIEKFFDKKVFLELYVKVEKDWRNQENKLRAFGYIE